jgi:hypothetical protein
MRLRLVFYKWLELDTLTFEQVAAAQILTATAHSAIEAAHINACSGRRSMKNDRVSNLKTHLNISFSKLSIYVNNLLRTERAELEIQTW